MTVLPISYLYLFYIYIIKYIEHRRAAIAHACIVLLHASLKSSRASAVFWLERHTGFSMTFILQQRLAFAQLLP